MDEFSVTTTGNKYKIEEEFKTRKNIIDGYKDKALKGLSSPKSSSLFKFNLEDDDMDGGTRKFKKRRSTTSKRSKVKRS